jgi:hypothetical protein
MEPTIREIKVLLNSMEEKLPKLHYNDRRVEGGRIKLIKMYNENVLLNLENKLKVLFPKLEIKVYNWDSSPNKYARFGGVYTCVSWKRV